MALVILRIQTDAILSASNRPISVASQELNLRLEEIDGGSLWTGSDRSIDRLQGASRIIGELFLVAIIETSGRIKDLGQLQLHDAITRIIGNVLLGQADNVI